MPNYFDRFDAPSSAGNFFDRFDAAVEQSPEHGGARDDWTPVGPQDDWSDVNPPAPVFPVHGGRPAPALDFSGLQPLPVEQPPEHDQSQSLDFSGLQPMPPDDWVSVTPAPVSGYGGNFFDRFDQPPAPPAPEGSIASVAGRGLGQGAVTGFGSALRGTAEEMNRRSIFEPWYETYQNFGNMTRDQQTDVYRRIQADPKLTEGEKGYLQSQMGIRPGGKPANLDEFAGVPAPETSIYKAGQAIEKFGRESFPLTQAESESLTGRISTGVGQFAGAVGPAAVAGALGQPEVGLVLGGVGIHEMAAQSAAAEADRAREAGATEAQAAKVARTAYGETLALSAAPVGSVLKEVERTAPGVLPWAVARFRQAVRTGLIFTGFGEAQEWLASKARRDSYDPKASYSPDMKRLLTEFATGAIVGPFGPTSVRERPASSADATLATPARPVAGRPSAEEGRPPSARPAASTSPPADARSRPDLPPEAMWANQPAVPAQTPTADQLRAVAAEYPQQYQPTPEQAGAMADDLRQISARKQAAQPVSSVTPAMPEPEAHAAVGQKEADEGLFAPERPKALPGFDQQGQRGGPGISQREAASQFLRARLSPGWTPLEANAAARDYVLQRGAEQGHEHLVAWDGNRNAFVDASTSRHPGWVGTTPDLDRAIADPESSVVIHHNHPRGVALSDGDVAMLANPGMAGVIAHAPDGHFSGAQLTPAFQDFARGNWRSIAPALDKVWRAVAKSMKARLDPLVNSGHLDWLVANHAISEVFNHALESLGITDYVGSRPPLNGWDALLPEAIKGAHDAAAAAGLPVKDLGSALSYHVPRGVQPQEALGRFLGRAEETAGRRLGSAVGDQAGRGPPQRGLSVERLEYEPPSGGGGRPPEPPSGAASPPGEPPGSPPRPEGQRVLTTEERRTAGIVARSAIGKIFSPATVSPEAARQAARQREEIGRSRRLDAQAAKVLEHFRNSVPSHFTKEGDNFMAFLEGRSSGARLADESLRPAADLIRQLNKDRQNALSSLSDYERRAWIEDYYAHMWENPKDALKKLKDSTARAVARQGSGRNLKQRVIPTYADGIAMGLRPLHPNIIDGEMAYLANIDRFIAHNRIFGRMRAADEAKYFVPGREPEGWNELRGRLAAKMAPISNETALPLKAYAPEDIARVYNNMLSRGVYESPTLGPIYDRLVRFKNGMTAAELTLSPFHAVTESTEAFFSQIVRGLADIANGVRRANPVWVARGVGKTLTSPAAVVTDILRGRRGAAEYLRPGSAGDGTTAHLVNLLTDANTSPLGRGAQQYFTSRRGAYRSFKDVTDAFRYGWTRTVNDWKNSKLRGIVAPPKELVSNAARVADTIMAPLFDYAIPRMKMGAMMGRLGDWLEHNPDASLTEQRAKAREIADSIDNRFGELNYDNIAVHAIQKQMAWAGLRAFGWLLGTWREIGGGVADLARGRITERVGYLAALAMGTAFINGLLTYLNTGRPPTGMDFNAYDTGKRDGRGNPIRATIPGYAREVEGLGFNVAARGLPAAGSYAYGKVASMWQAMYELATNRDWRGEPIGPPDAWPTGAGRKQMPEFLKRYAEEFFTHYTPMNWRGALGLAEDTNTKGLSPIERALTIRDAPFAMQNPEAARRFFDYGAAHPQSPQQLWQKKRAREMRESRQ